MRARQESQFVLRQIKCLASFYDKFKKLYSGKVQNSRRRKEEFRSSDRKDAAYSASSQFPVDHLRTAQILVKIANVCRD